MKSIALMLCMALVISASGCGKLFSGKSVDDIINGVVGAGNGGSGQGSAQTAETGISETTSGNNGEERETVAAIARKLLLGAFAKESAANVDAAVKEPGYSSLSEAVNYEAFHFDPAEEALLKNNGFVVSAGGIKEFYKYYEMNRYDNIANFVTVDSMMHAYHMYFAYLLKSTERAYLSDLLLSLSETMLSESREQYDALLGTEWEDAARRNVVFFTVGAALQNENEMIDGYAADMVNTELNRIYDANAIDISELTGVRLDYSQFKPRGYYAGDAGLEKYFRAMMWYGQVAFVHREELLDREALLMNMALQEGAIDLWEMIYSVTSFFAGASDDLSYYEYMPAVWAAYGNGAGYEDLIGDPAPWEAFRSYIDAMPAPSINSVPMIDDHNPDTHSNLENKGFRFMGQRFTIDEAVFQQLIYDYVLEDPSGAQRLLPDTLDVAAALGSEEAYRILDEQGDTAFEGYPENMEMVRTAIQNASDDLWGASLYSAWIYTLTPLLGEKGEGYPDFMKNSAWARKDLETFAGSYAELKHDTVLYAKQVVAEMGGWEIPDWDTRGYVEPEVEVWARFEALASKTAEGLLTYGMIGDTELGILNELADLAAQFKVISEKELRGELLTAEEYELIEYFGGNLEHLWRAALADEGDRIDISNFPAAIVCDIATDPNGWCLEVATGNPSRIRIMVYFDGAYHICSGAMYSFYQFEQPLSERLTDVEWRQMMGLALNDDGRYDNSNAKEQPEWTQIYRFKK